MSTLQELFQRSAVWRSGDPSPLPASLPAPLQIKVPLVERRFRLLER
jgi:hypothetical protein